MVNMMGLKREDYRGYKSTLCPGCGHDSVSNQIISVAHELGLPPHRIFKISGDGCAAKSTGYFLRGSHGLRVVSAGAPATATGAILANCDQLAMCISGDGEGLDAGLGHLKHMIRRNVPAVFILENNGVFGLTGGQTASTLDTDDYNFRYGHAEFPVIDPALEALVSGCGFVARSFSGDAKQLQTLLKAAIAYHGTAFIDVISPCVVFNNFPQNRHSYSSATENEMPLQDISYLDPSVDDVDAENRFSDSLEQPRTIMVEMTNGDTVKLVLLEPGKNHDPRDKESAVKLLERAKSEHSLITGLIYYDPNRKTVHETQNLSTEPIVKLPAGVTCPSPEDLKSIMKTYM